MQVLKVDNQKITNVENKVDEITNTFDQIYNKTCLSDANTEDLVARTIKRTLSNESSNSNSNVIRNIIRQSRHFRARGGEVKRR